MVEVSLVCCFLETRQKLDYLMIVALHHQRIDVVTQELLHVCRGRILIKLIEIVAHRLLLQLLVTICQSLHIKFKVLLERRLYLAHLLGA